MTIVILMKPGKIVKVMTLTSTLLPAEGRRPPLHFAHPVEGTVPPRVKGTVPPRQIVGLLLPPPITMLKGDTPTWTLTSAEGRL